MFCRDRLELSLFVISHTHTNNIESTKVLSYEGICAIRLFFPQLEQNIILLTLPLLRTDMGAVFDHV